MATLSATEADGLFALLPELYALTPVDVFPRAAVRITRRLIPCETASFNQIGIGDGTFRVLVDPLPDSHEEYNDAFGRFMYQHPVIAHVGATGDSTPLAISDFLRPAEFRRLALYGELYGALGIEDQLSVTFSAVPGTTVLAVALNRPGPFAERDRAMLEMLRPHLRRAYLNAVRFTAVGIGAGDDGLDEKAGAKIGLLTDRQYEVLELVARGFTNAKVAQALDVRTATVKKHLEHIAERLGTDSRLGAAWLHLLAARPASNVVWWELDGSGPPPVTISQSR